MTLNEQKILECIWNHGGKARIQHVAHKTKLSSDYSLFLCRSLAKAGHLEFVNPNVCQLAEKGYGRFSILAYSAEAPLSGAKDGQDHTGIEVVAASSTLQEGSTDNPALSSATSPAGDKGAARETEENVSGNDNKHDQEGIAKPAVSPIDHIIELMIKKIWYVIKRSFT